MKVAIGADHAGVDLKETLKKVLEKWKYEVIDVGTWDEKSVDYPDIAERVAKAVAAKDCDCGILICGTGIGMTISANKVKGIRAASCSDIFTAKMSKKHNDLTVLCLGARVVSVKKAKQIVKVWLKTKFEYKEERHARRVDKIARLERAN